MINNLVSTFEVNNINQRRHNGFVTLRMAGETELGPLHENAATFVVAGKPVNVVAEFILTVGDL